MMRHTLILSDLHLWQVTDHDDLWMRYRHRSYTQDGQIAELLARVYAEIGGAPLELILNGDVFDFDIPPVVGGHARPAPIPRTGQSARARLAAILDDHEEFLATLATVLARGDRVIFISGNHDIQLSLPEVRNYLVERLINKLRILFPDARDYRAYQRIRFRSWYYQTADGIHVEHGNQYDLYCSVSDPTAPLHPFHRLRPNAGSLVIEHLIGHLGYFNPNVESTFLLTTREYLAHWRRFYQRSRRSLVGTWFFGSLRIIWQLGRTSGWRGSRRGEPAVAGSASAAQQRREHAALFALPDVRAAMRVLCIDRALLGILLFAIVVLAWICLPLAGVLLVGTLGLVGALRPPGPCAGLDGVAAQVETSARAIARIYGVRAVVFGHTHQAAGQWERGVFFGNCGTWAPMYHDVACRRPVQQSRPVIWLRADGPALTGGLYRFLDGRLHPYDEFQATPGASGLALTRS
jgi:UDP-2,3-diacylglucosamine pyrophosphatase LpxH